MSVKLTLLSLLGAAAAAPQIKPLNVSPMGFRYALSGFTSGPAANSTMAMNAAIPGAYQVKIDSFNPAFPYRTVFAPVGVPAGTSVPVVAWAQGNCYIYGNMYRDFLSEIASHGYMVVAPGSPAEILYPEKTDNKFLDHTIDAVMAYAPYAPIGIDTGKIAVAGHQCGGYQATETMAYDEGSRITTGIFFNAQGMNSSIENFSAPSLWIGGGATDPAQVDKSFAQLTINDKFIPTYKAEMATGSKGTFWMPRGGAYAEAAVAWLDLWLKNDQAALAAFPAGNVEAAGARGWVTESNAFPTAQRTNLPPQ